MSQEEILTRIAATVVDAADPVRLILFGSHARGDAGASSDYDLMVVERHVNNRMQEMVRLSRLLRPLQVPLDLLVVTADAFDYWKDTPGNVYHAAATEGRILYEAA